MKNKEDQRCRLNLFLLFILAVTVFFMGHCRSIPSKYSEEVLSKQKTLSHETPPLIEHLDGVDLLATVKGEFLYKGEEIRFRALLQLSAQGKMRLEIFNPFGKMLSAAIFTRSHLSLYIPSQKVFYYGTGTSDDMLKLFGLRIEAAKVVDILSGMESFLALKKKGLFSTVEIQEGSSWNTAPSEEDLWFLARKGGALILKGSRDDEIGDIEIHSRYMPVPEHDTCLLIVPEENVIVIEDRSVMLKVRMNEVRSYMLHADGKLYCGFEEEGIALGGEEVFTAHGYEEKSGMEIIDLNRITLGSPLFIGE